MHKLSTDKISHTFDENERAGVTFNTLIHFWTVITNPGQELVFFKLSRFFVYFSNLEIILTDLKDVHEYEIEKYFGALWFSLIISWQMLQVTKGIDEVTLKHQNFRSLLNNSTRFIKKTRIVQSKMILGLSIVCSLVSRRRLLNYFPPQSGQRRIIRDFDWTTLNTAYFEKTSGSFFD